VQHEVGIVTKLWDGQSKNQSFILDVGEDFLLSKTFRLALGLTKVKRLGSAADRSSSSRVLTVCGTILLLPHTSSRYLI